MLASGQTATYQQVVSKTHQGINLRGTEASIRFRPCSLTATALAASLCLSFTTIQAQTAETPQTFEETRTTSTLFVPEVTVQPRVPPRPLPFKTVPQALTAQEQPRDAVMDIVPQSLIEVPRIEPAMPLLRRGADVEDAPWVLEPDQKPWPLHYMEPSLPTRLVISPPTVNELRLFLPGQVSDFIDRTRYAVTRYITDSLGAATSMRRRQLEQVQSWLKKIFEQQSTLPKDDWPQYQFSKDTRIVVAEYRTKIEAQSTASIERFVVEANNLIASLTELMPVMPTHDMRKATYDLMVKIQEGAEIFQGQLATDDALILRTLDEGLRKVPVQDVPDHRPPSQESSPLGGGWRPMTQTSTSMPSRSLSEAPRYDATLVPEQRYNPALPARQERRTQNSDTQRIPQTSINSEDSSGSSLLGYLVLAVAGFGVFGLISRMRKKKPV